MMGMEEEDEGSRLREKGASHITRTRACAGVPPANRGDGLAKQKDGYTIRGNRSAMLLIRSNMLLFDIAACGA